MLKEIHPGVIDGAFPHMLAHKSCKGAVIPKLFNNRINGIIYFARRYSLMKLTTRLFIIISAIVILLTSCGVSDAIDPNLEVSTTPTYNTAASSPTLPTGTTTEVTSEQKLLFPQLDSSTARKEMVASIYNDLVIDGKMTGKEPLCSKTHVAICNLIDGKVDVVFALLPTEEEQKYMKEKGIDLKARCYAYDALMILGNSQNPVKNLSSDQIRDIYRKKITNWKDVGGIDAKISVYVRDSQSGSQRMFESLVWDGQKDIPDFQDGSYTDMEIQQMDEIINMVEQDVNAIGFSFMTFVDGEFGTSEYLKSFAVDDINPTDSNISNESYPFITTAWMLMRAEEPSDSPAQWLFDWFVGENAQKYITKHTSSIPAINDPIIIKAE